MNEEKYIVSGNLTRLRIITSIMRDMVPTDDLPAEEIEAFKNWLFVKTEQHYSSGAFAELTPETKYQTRISPEYHGIKTMIAHADEKLKVGSFNDLLKRLKEYKKVTGAEVESVAITITSSALYEDDELRYELASFALSRPTVFGETK